MTGGVVTGEKTDGGDDQKKEGKASIHGLRLRVGWLLRLFGVRPFAVEGQKSAEFRSARKGQSFLLQISVLGLGS